MLVRAVGGALVLAMLAFNGCMCGGGGKTTVQTTTKTCGEELTDLKTALDSGAMTQREYDRTRKAIMDRCD